MSPVTIRDADPERDAVACAAIYAPHVEASPTSFEERPPSAGEIAARIERAAETHAWLVAVGDGEVLGYAYACSHRERPAYRWAADVSVYVSDARRRQGVGRDLYLALFERLRQQGLRMACAGITLPNEASVVLHERLGFVPAGVFRRIGWKLGAWRDVGWWQLELSPESDEQPAEPLAPGAQERAGYHWPMPENDTAALTEDDVIEALEEVIDPELGLDFVSLGLVYDVEIEKEDVYVTFTLTTPACPIGPQVSEQMKEFVGDLPGVSAVHPKMIFDPPWSPEMMTDDAKFALGF
jgi:L-amino acid N-acyltransferase YncA/metal-sulfur cluster biosynthetic enzyme